MGLHAGRNGQAEEPGRHERRQEMDPLERCHEATVAGWGAGTRSGKRVPV